MKTSELIGAALDWAVDKCNYMSHSLEPDYCLEVGYAPSYSTDWALGGPIIEREKLWVGYSAARLSLRLIVMEDAVVHCRKILWPHRSGPTTGPTILIAAMRCYVASKLGDEIEIPKEYKQ